MSRRLLFGGVLAVLCIVALVFGGALLSATLAAETPEEILAEEHGFSAENLDKLGAEADPIGYGGAVNSETERTDRYGPVAEPYWRTATYNRYTGEAWELTDAVENISSDIPDSSETNQYTIETGGLSEAVPAPKRTTAVDTASAESLRLAPDGSVRATGAFSPGTTMTIESAERSWTYDDFEEVSSGYPDAYSPYTTIPGELPSRVIEQADELTEDVESPYVTAILLEKWLLTEKEYSPDAERSSDWLSDEFLFEREDGTSEFFATAFATMARTQDIPARYVTGFAPGEQTDDGQEAIRGTQAHAWVELYFDDIGWVTFDPTPADHIDEREAAVTKEDAETVTGIADDGTTGAASGIDVSLSTVDEPTDVASSKLHSVTNLAGSETLQRDTQQFEASDEWEPVEGNISVEFVESPTPGTTGTVQVTEEGEPRSDHRVSVDGTVEGLTDTDGQLEIEIPYTDELTIAVERYTGDGSPTEEGADESADSDEDEPPDDHQNESASEDESDTGDASDEITGGEGTTDGGLGALSPGETTGVGGDVGFDPETYGNSDTSVHFTVESDEPAYWRTDAFDEYTGSGWEQTGESEPYDEPLEHSGEDGERVEYEVTLEREATALPTVWRPETIEGVNGLSVTEQSGISADEPIPAGTEFSGISSTPVDDVETLRAADGEYPSEILDQYTQRPANEPERIDELTADIVEDEQTTYNKAMAVQEWLRSEKEYSLDVGTTSDQIADTFLFEMDAGYCEYFATAMVSMLRSQDIPTRYAVGYATGEEVETDTYEVRGINAHAWVEVYFPEIGWVTFDPTPGDDRLSNEQEALERDDPAHDPSLASNGSPGESFTASDIERETDAIVDENDFEVGGYADHLAVSQEVSVGDAVKPQSDQLRFVVSDTDQTELVRIAELPPVASDETDLRSLSSPSNEAWASEFICSGCSEATTPNAISQDIQWSSTPLARGSGSGSTVTGATGLFAPSSSNSITERPTLESVSSEHSGEFNFSLDGDISVSLDNQTTPGSPLTVEATVDGIPVPDATVELFENETREELLTTGRTDSDGQATVDLPATDSIFIGVERDSFSGTASHEIDSDVNIEFLDTPVPGEEVPVSVTSAGEPVPGIPVVLAVGEDGETELQTEEATTVQTDEDGVSSLSVPYGETFVATIERETFDESETATISPEMNVSAGETPGENVTVSVTADGEPVSGLVVSPGDEETGDNGSATVTLPFENETAITASRGELELTEHRSVSGELEVTTDGLALPGTDLDVTATIDGEPVKDAEVTLDGDEIGTTDDAGTATIQLPLDPTVSGDIIATRGKFTSQTTVPVQYPWAVVGVLLLGCLGIAIQRGAIRGWLSGSYSLTGAILTGIIRFINRLRSLGDRFESGVTDGGLVTSARNSGGQTAGKSSKTIRYWKRFVALVGAEPSDTPADIATRAVEAGLPKKQVRRITAAYRSYRYGNHSSDEPEELQEAVELVEREVEE